MVSRLSCSTKLSFKWHFINIKDAYWKALKKKFLVETTLLSTHSIGFFATVLTSKVGYIILVLGRDGQNHPLDLTVFTQTLLSSAKLCPLLCQACSVPATCLLTEKEQILEHHFPRWSTPISISKWGNCWCRKSLNKKASPSNVHKQGHISWQWSWEVNDHYKEAPIRGRSAHSKGLCQAPRSVHYWVVCYVSTEALTAGERAQALL